MTYLPAIVAAITTALSRPRYTPPLVRIVRLVPVLPTSPAPKPIVCRDGWISPSRRTHGTCSHHGGCS